jgi:hypothetical protein
LGAAIDQSAPELLMLAGDDRPALRDCCELLAEYSLQVRMIAIGVTHTTQRQQGCEMDPKQNLHQH